MVCGEYVLYTVVRYRYMVKEVTGFPVEDYPKESCGKFRGLRRIGDRQAENIKGYAPIHGIPFDIFVKYIYCFVCFGKERP